MKTILTIMHKTGMKFKGFMFFYLIISIIVAAAMLFANIFEGYLAETALESDMTAMRNYLLLITVAIGIRAIFSGMQTFFRRRYRAKAEYNLRNYFIDHFLRVPFNKVEATGSGEVLSVYSNDIENTAGLVVSEIAFVIEGVAISVVSLFFLITGSTLFGGEGGLSILTLILIFAGMIGSVILIMQPMQRFQKQASEERARYNEIVNDSLQNLSVVAAYSLEDVVEERYMTAYLKYMKIIKKVSFASISMVFVTLMAMLGPLAVVNVMMAFRVIDGHMSIPGFITYNAMLMMTVMGLSMMANHVGNMVSSMANAKRVIENTDSKPEENNAGNTTVDTRVPLDIRFDNVTFTYQNNDTETVEKPTKEKKKRGIKISFGSPPPQADSSIEETEEIVEPTPTLALENVSFEIKAGSKVAFVGGSGSGKSTVLKLLLGLYEPTDGKVEVAGNNITNMSKQNIRELSAYVPQDSFLFPESIGENITLSQSVENEKRLEKACEQAGVLDFINSLPDGFNSVLAESSENISGGQRQRIAMARALYKDAPVILFDEATSALDPATESAIIDSLTKAAADKTVIMVTHRTKPIAMCDTIIVMDAGKVVGIGTHEELTKTCPAYQKLEVAQNV